MKNSSATMPAQAERTAEEENRYMSTTTNGEADG